MAARKPKASKAASAGADAPIGPRPTSLPVAAIPDFDEDTIIGQLNDLDALAKDLVRHLGAVQEVAEEARRSGLTRTLAMSERAWQLTTSLGEAEAGVAAYAARLRPVRSGLDLWKAGERRSRRSRFEGVAAEMGWKLVGSWPEPVIEGIVFVAADETKDRTTVNGRLVVAPTAERLADCVAADLEQLIAHRSPPNEFVASVWQAYQSSGGTPGHGVVVHDLLAELTWKRQSKAFQRDPRQDLYRGYSAAQFRADLTHYLSAGSPPVEDAGKRYALEVVGGSFAQEGLFMYFPQTDRLATCGRLTFRLAERELP